MADPAPPPALDPAPQAPPLVRPPISPGEALGLLALGLAITALARLLGTSPTSVGGAVAPALVVLAWVGPAWWLVTRRKQDPLVALAMLGWPRGLALAVAVSLAILALFVVALVARSGAPEQPLGPALSEALQTALWQVAFVALPEEVFFRGVLLPALQKDDARGLPVLGARLGGAVVVQALLFGASHLVVDLAAGQPPTALRALTVFPAIWFAWLRLRTGSVWPGVLAHALSNGVLLACSRVGLLG